MLPKKFSSLLLAIILIASIIIPFIPHSVFAGWYNASWQYRKSVNVTTAITDYQSKLYIGESVGSVGYDVHCEGHCQSDFDDLRFTGADEVTLLDYWIESVNGTSPNQTAIVWVENDATPSATWYMYYGNAGASSSSNGTNTFLFFDHFDVDLSKWVTGGTPSIAGSILTLNANNENVKSSGTYSTNTALRSRMYYTNNTGGTLIMQYGNWADVTSNCRISDHSINLFDAVSYDDGGTGETTNLANMERDYAVYDIIRNSTTSVIFRKNDSVIATHFTKIGTQARNIGFYNASTTDTIYADWILVRKYAATEPSFAFGAEESQAGSPTVTTDPATNIEETTATGSGNITGIGADYPDMRGWDIGTATGVYGTNTTESGNFTVGVFTTPAITALTQADKYFYRAKAHNTQGWGYGAEYTFFTKPSKPDPFTATVANSTGVDLAWTNFVVGAGATAYTYIMYKDGAAPANRADGTLAANITGTVASVHGLTAGHTYYFRAWTWGVESDLGQWSDDYADATATPLPLPVVVTEHSTGHGRTWAILNGEVVSSSGVVTQRGFDFGLTDAYGDSTVYGGSFGNATYSYLVTGLTPATVYHYRAKAIDDVGWGYGGDLLVATLGSPTPYEQFETGTPVCSNTAIHGANWTYQTFTTNTTGQTITSVRLYMQRTGNPGTVTVSIKHTDDSGNATGSDLCSATLDGDTFPTVATLEEFTFTETSLEASMTYAIVVRALNGDTTNYVCWQWIATGGYADGNAGYSISNGASWTSVAASDYWFEVWGNPVLEIISAKVFTNYVSSTAGDWVIALHYRNTFAPYYPSSDCKTYFALQLVDGTTVKAQTVCPDWGYRLGSIYLSSDMVASLEWGYGYRIRIYGTFTGNPYAEYELQATDWLGSDLTGLDRYVLSVIALMENYYDTTFTEYISGKGRVLNEQGGILAEQGIPSLVNIRPDLFSVAASEAIYEEGTFTQPLQATYVWQTNVGGDASALLTSIGNLFGGVDGGTVGAMIFFVLWTVFAAVAVPAGHVIAGLTLNSPLILIAIWIGFISLTLMGILVAIIVVLFMWQMWWKSAA